MLCSLGAYIRTCTRPRYPLELVSTHTPCQKRNGKKKEERKRKGPPLSLAPSFLGGQCLRQPVRKISLCSLAANGSYALPSEKNSAWCRAQGVDARTANPIDPATSAAPHAPHLLAKVRLPAGKPTTLLLADRRWPRLIAQDGAHPENVRGVGRPPQRQARAARRPKPCHLYTAVDTTARGPPYATPHVVFRPLVGPPTTHTYVHVARARLRPSLQ